MADQTLTQGQSYTDPLGITGTVGFDSNTGKPLSPGQTTTATPTGLSSIATPSPQNTNATVPSGTQPNQSGAGLPDNSFLNVLNGLNQGFQQNNDYTKQKNIVVNAMLGQPVSADQLATLPPEIQSIVKSGDRNQLMMQAQVLNDQISGYGKGIASSIQYLTQGYQTSQQQAETQKTDALNVLKELYTETGDSSALTQFIKTNYPAVATSQISDIVNNVVGSVGIGDAIAAQEHGNYTTVNPNSGALGKYQILPINLTYAGLTNTPENIQKFLASPELQDKAYQAILADLATKYNNDPAKIAAAYYGGSVGAEKYGTPAGDVKQGNYPSINDYVKSVLSKLPNQTTSTGTSYNQYGLLSNTSFNPTNRTDQAANNYLTTYLKTGAIPTPSQLGISTRAGTGLTQFSNIATRANDLFYQATGQPLPSPAIVKSNLALISGNNQLLNNLGIQSTTVGKNFALAVKNLDASNLNQNVQPINAFLDSVKNALGDPAVSQYLAQNATLSNEIGSLLAVKNATGTTVHDKLESAGLITNKMSADQEVQVIKTILQEAQNSENAIKSQNADLYSSIDPLQQDSNNPNRTSSSSSNSQLESQVTAAGYDYAKMKADGHSDEEIKSTLGIQ